MERAVRGLPVLSNWVCRITSVAAVLEKSRKDSSTELLPEETPLQKCQVPVRWKPIPFPLLPSFPFASAPGPPVVETQQDQIVASPAGFVRG